MWWKDIGSKVESFNEEKNGNNHSLVGKQAKKITRGRQGGFYHSLELIKCLLSRVGGINDSRAKTNQNSKISK